MKITVHKNLGWGGSGKQVLGNIQISAICFQKQQIFSKTDKKFQLLFGDFR